MARFWAFVTFAATVLLSGLASMTEDRMPLLSALTAPLSIEPATKSEPAANASAPMSDPAERRSYERRNQRGQGMAAAPAEGRATSEAKGGQAGTMVLANLTAAPRQDTGPAGLGPIVAVPLALQADAGALPPGSPSGRATNAARHRRDPLPRRASGSPARESQGYASVEPALTAAADAATVALAPADAATSAGLGRIAKGGPVDSRPHEHVRAGGRHPAAHRKSQGTRHHGPALGSSTGPRRALARRMARNESLWHRNQRDGS